MENEIAQIINLIVGKGMWFFLLYIIYKNVWSITLLLVCTRSLRLIVNKVLDFISEYKEKSIEQQKLICTMKEELLMEVRKEFHKEVENLCEAEKKQSK